MNFYRILLCQHCFSVEMLQSLNNLGFVIFLDEEVGMIARWQNLKIFYAAQKNWPKQKSNVGNNSLETVEYCF
jgi:hypothetical protein